MLRSANQLRLATKFPAPVAKASAVAAHLTTQSSPSMTGNTQNPTRDQTQATSAEDSAATVQKERKEKKTMAELDEELRLKLEGMSGEGGAAGVEYENGRAEGLKRGVKSNMFRVI
ncbi:uncharacterized protein GLRG_09168 [Colletotrichum graminicola M1.001]|uniref:Uncharacterized protein n=1 Tax=Colletotrichum graminicola (strain M1.001 / M2 / FGSC 10212) TaxID=645133 RepID=E3QT36_COLGM|nr:uncharacterized protein GLRG_09168 [Colletotrichum graminicola M1.001]EFQ34024.1 hypothetical protein GLRG_09168 [Colletotrichum graminicola M1.001]